MNTCPHCNGPLIRSLPKYHVSPTPHAYYVCRGTCQQGFAYYKSGPDEILVSFAEDQYTPWDEFVRRKWEEYYDKKRRDL